MSTHWSGFVSLLLLACFPPRAWAPVVFSFPGLELLTARADHVVVAEVLPPADGRFGNSGYSFHNIRVLAALKGELQPGIEAEALLRALPLEMNSSLLHGRGGFMAMERYVLFLSNSTPDSRFAFRSTNDMGNSFWVPPSSDLSDLPRDSMRDAIRSLLDDVLAYDNGRLAELRDVVSAYLE